MPILALGINHKTAPINIREKLAFSKEVLCNALHDLKITLEINAAVIVSTCNRTEIYCESHLSHVEPISQWLTQYHQLPPESLSPYLYSHADQDAVRHILRVASGLDSLILGEPQILGQMKEAYQSANEAGMMGKLLGRLFQHTFSVAKQVRTDTEIGSSPVSVAFAAVSLARQILGDLSEQTCLLIGAGETIELVARHLSEHKIKRQIVANRTLEKAHALAQNINGYAIALSEIPEHIAEADIIIASTGSQTPILGKGTVESALKVRKHSPVFMVDIAVPRDIEPEIAILDDVYLYTVDDLKEIIEENMQSRKEAAAQAEEIIETQVLHFIGWMQSLNVVNTICQYRSNAEQYKQEVLEKSLKMIRNGKDPEQVIQQLAHNLTNKLTHHVCTKLQEAGAEGRHDFIRHAQELLEMSDQS